MPQFDLTDARQARFAAYGPAPLPESRDEEVQQFVDSLIEGGPAAVAKAIAVATEHGRRVLRAYAERMASLAVRQKDPDLLLGAVVALVVGGLDKNARESLMAMAPIDDSARRLDVRLSDLFERASRIVGHPGTVNLVMWLNRRPEDRSLKSMGFVAAEEPEGFRYKQSWP